MSAAHLTDSPPRRPGTWALRFGILCLVVAISPFAWQGFSAWSDHGQVRRTVIDFFQLLSEGRRSAAAQHLSSELLVRFSRSPGTTEATARGVTIQVFDIHQHGDEALVNASISKQGFSLRPMVKLHREKSTWKIVAIEGVDVDPRWTRMQAQTEGDSLADELAEKLHAAE